MCLSGVHLSSNKSRNLLAAAVIGTAIGLAVAYFCKNSSDIPEENDPAETEDDDFDLDADLQPASDREYVSLKKTDDDTDGESESLEEK